MDLTELFKAIITLISVIITTFVIPWLKTKIEAEKLEKIRAYVEIAVHAAEQMYKGPGLGTTKKEYVIAYLASMGLVCDVDTINAMIEAAVQEMNSQLKE